LDNYTARGQGYNARRKLSKERSRLFFALGAIATIALSLAACVRDLDDKKAGKILNDDEMALVTLSLSTPATRAAEGSETENRVDVVDVFLFTADDDKLYYRASGVDITDDGSANKITKTFTVRLPFNPLDASDDPIPYRVVVLANARAQITHAPATISPAPSATRQTFLNGLAIPVPTSGGGRLASPFPMWGYAAANLVITESSPAPFLSINLTRAVARVDVSVDKSKVVNFALTSARLYNYSVSGYIAPEVDGSGYNAVQWDGTKAIATRDPFPASIKAPNDGFIPYDIATDGVDTDNDNDKDAFVEAIYAFEAATGKPVTGTGWEKNTCLVIGGLYDDEVNPPYPTYYRIEFHNTTDGNLPLLRNYLYRVVIEEVKADGWGTPELAYANKPSNIVATITEWNDGGLNDVTFNDQNYIAVDKSRVTLYKDGSAKIVKVSTDYGGWTINIPNEPGNDWFEVSPASYSGDDSERSISVSMKSSSALADDAPDRPGHFYIVAGNLKKEIFITQLNEVEFTLAIIDPVSGKPVTELLFGPGDGANPPAAQTFRATWLPVSIPSVDVAIVPGAIPFTYNAGSADFSTSPVAGANGSVDFTVQPTAITTADIGAADPFTYVRSSRLDFSATLGGQHRMLPIYLRQEYYALVVEGVDANGYLADETLTHSFTVKSNRAWTASITNSTQAARVLSMTTSGDASAAGVPFSFTFKNRTHASNANPQNVTITFSSVDGSFPDKTVTIINNAQYFSLTAQGVNSDGYLADGSTQYSFTVASNRAWTASITNSAQAALVSSMTTSGNASATGVTFSFKLKERVTAASGVDPKTITFTFKSATGSFSNKTVAIKNNAYYLALAQTSYTPTVLTAHNFTVNLNTNIPYNKLSAQIATNSQSMLSNPTILNQSPLKLQARMAANTVGVTAASGKVTVSYSTLLTCTLTVNIVAYPFKEVNGKLVTIATVSATAREVHAGTVSCPYGSSTPRNENDALWYVENLPYKGLATNYYEKQNNYGMTWLGATFTTCTETDEGNNMELYRMAYWLFNDYREWVAIIDGPIMGIGNRESAMRGVYFYVNAPGAYGIHCVVW
jgi:hypothetical protein